MINLGDKVKDSVSGIIGIVTQRTEYLNGCIQYGVQPKVTSKNPDEIKTWIIDEEQLTKIGGLKKVKKSRNGGPTRKL